jgi:hypothetical protein
MTWHRGAMRCWPTARRPVQAGRGEQAAAAPPQLDRGMCDVDVSGLTVRSAHEAVSR